MCFFLAADFRSRYVITYLCHDRVLLLVVVSVNVLFQKISLFLMHTLSISGESRKLADGRLLPCMTRGLCEGPVPHTMTRKLQRDTTRFVLLCHIMHSMHDEKRTKFLDCHGSNWRQHLERIMKERLQRNHSQTFPSRLRYSSQSFFKKIQPMAINGIFTTPT